MYSILFRLGKWSLIALLLLAFILACRTADLITSRLPSNPTTVAQNPGHTAATKTPSHAHPTYTPASNQEPTEEIPAAEPPTDEPPPPPPSDVPPTDVPPTRKPLPTSRPKPTLSPTPSGPTDTPAPTRCPQTYCVKTASCLPGQDTRAIGTVYLNGAPQNGVRVRVSNAYKGAAVAADFISGFDPINPGKLDPLHPGYYQIGIVEGSPRAGNWWVFLIDDHGNVMSEGHVFNTQDQATESSCQIGITDFAR